MAWVSEVFNKVLIGLPSTLSVVNVLEGRQRSPGDAPPSGEPCG